jgi:tRNA A-37 threonylcarbamoyl transferase component Bud32
VDASIKLNTAFHPRRVMDASLEDAVKTVHTNRQFYQYYNNWLSDHANRIVAFQCQDKMYVMKRTTVARAAAEIRNAVLIKSVVHGVEIQRYTVKVATPYFIKLNKRTGYIVTEYLGEDVNQLYSTGHVPSRLEEVIPAIQQKFLSHGLIYAGLLPRNTIIDGNTIFLIDFEDLNEKKRADAETGYKISWSYFLKNITHSIENTPDMHDPYPETFNRVIGIEHENPYEIALAAESSGNGYKNDDAICTLSPYISLEREIMLDILLYAEKTRQVEIAVAARLFALAERVRILAVIKRKADIIREVTKAIDKLTHEISGHGITQQELQCYLAKSKA